MRNLKDTFSAFFLFLVWMSLPGAHSIVPVQAAPAEVGSGSPAQVEEEAGTPENAAPSGKESKEKGKSATHPKKRTLDLRSPQATMQTFLLAMQDAAGERPERIDDAVACLDTSKLEGAGREKRARLLARRLHAIIDKKGVKLDDLPSETDEQDYVFLPGSSPKSRKPQPEIRLARDSKTGQWLFTAHTLESIPALEESLAKTAEKPKPEDAGIPAARRSARATMATFLDAMNADPRNLERAALCLDPTGRDVEAWKTVGKELAVKLKFVIDRIKMVVLTEIPDSQDGDPYVWHASETGNIVVARVVEDSKTKNDSPYAPVTGEWRFTPQTLDTLDALFAELENKALIPELAEAGATEDLTPILRFRRQMPPWLREQFWQLEGWQWVALGSLLPIGWLLKLATSGIAMLVLGVWLKRKEFEINVDARRQTVRSIGAVVMVLFWFYAIQNLLLPGNILGVLLRGTKLALGLTAVWVGYRFVDILGGHIAASKEIQLTRFDDVLIPMLRKILRVFIVLVVLVFVLQWMGRDLTAILGALGIGGFAIAFAAKDTIGNFFGSITVLFDRPFGIGDWIVIGDVEGTVERVGFRSTRVRTFYNSMVTIPNSRIVDTQVDNYGERQYRRVRIMLSVTYSTPPEKIDAFCEGIRELIRLHPYTRKDYYHVYFNKFAPSSLDILLYAFFEVPDWGTELRERHRLFIDILRLADKLGVEFAFPTQTLWLRNAGDGAAAERDAAMSDTVRDPDKLGLDRAARVFEEAYGPGPVHRAPVVIDRTPRSKRKQSK